MEPNSTVKPKQYTHIDYEALLIYIMKNHLSFDDATQELGLNIARSTMNRNIKKIKEKDENNSIIVLYQEGYLPNLQKDEIPEKIQEKVEMLPEKPVVVKLQMKDVYMKLYYMKQIIESCGGNLAEATRQINSGNTILGAVKISRQGLGKNMTHFEEVKKEYEKELKEENKLKDGREER